MAFSKWLSLGVGVACMLLVIALRAIDTAPIDAGGDNSLLSSIALGGILGLLLGAFHWIVVSRFDTEIHRVAANIESMQSTRSNTRDYKPGLGLDAVLEAVQLVIGEQKGQLTASVSKRRELEIELRVAEAERQRADAILNAISDAVVVTDAFNELSLANNSAEKLLDFDLEQFRRSPIDRVVQDVDLANIIKDTREGASSVPGFRRHVEHRLNHRGSARVFDVTVAGISSGKSEMGAAPVNEKENSGVVTVLRDITREKEIADMKSDFVSSVSHELRTPLSSIKAYMEMLVDGEANDDATRYEFYNIIQGETNRLSRLIDNILNISRIESGVVRVQRERIPIQRLIGDVVEVIQPQARTKNIALKFEGHQQCSFVFADKDMIYQAALNLLSNAIKYTPEGGEVEVAIEVHPIESTVEVAVRDSGVGIPAENIEHLFEKFYRVEQHKKIAKGTGLGLNLVKQIVETVHGGSVSVVSEKDKGSVFAFTLPLAE